MLIDDNKDDNFYHERVIKKSEAAGTIIAMESAQDALRYLSTEKSQPDAHPNIIFLDINMPGMNGWEFIEEYTKLDPKFQSKMVVVMLTTSDNPDHKEMAEKLYGVIDFKTKPLTNKILDEILTKYASRKKEI